MKIHHIIISEENLEQIIQKVVSNEFDKWNTGVNEKPIIENPNCLIAEASQITGLAISTIRTKCHFGEIPYFKPPGTKKLQFNREKLIMWMESGNNKTINELEKETHNYLTRKKK